MAIQYSPKVKEARENYLAVLKRIKAEKAAALKEWSDLSTKEADEAETVEEAATAFWAAPWGTPGKKHALERWAQLCTTVQELESVYDVTSSRFRVWDNPALKKWNDMAGVAVAIASSSEEIENAFFLSPRMRSYLRDPESACISAFKKWLALCSTLEELAYVNRRTHASQDMVLERLYRKRYNELCQQTDGKLPQRLTLDNVL